MRGMNREWGKQQGQGAGAATVRHMTTLRMRMRIVVAFIGNVVRLTNLKISCCIFTTVAGRIFILLLLLLLLLHVARASHN